jgi:hypothetical protein
MTTRGRLGTRAVSWLLVFSMTNAVGLVPVHASAPADSEGNIPASFQGLDISSARVTFRDNQTAEIRTMHVSNSKVLKRMAKMREGQELSLRYRRPAGATEPEIIGMSRPGDGWKRGAKIVVGVGVLFGLLVLGALLFGGD